MARLFDDAQNEFLRVASSPVGAEPFTLACWYKTDVNAWQAFMSVGDANGSYYFALRVTNNRFLVATMYDGDSDANAPATIQHTLNVWNHGCAVFAANNDFRIYLNGGNKGTNAAGHDVITVDQCAIGCSADSTPVHYVSSSIAEAAVWNAALNDEEAAALAGGVAPTRIRPESLVAYWPLYGVGSPEPDYRGTYNLTLFSDDSGPVQADHAPVQPPFGFGIGRIEPAVAAPPVGQPMQLRGIIVPHLRQWQPRAFS